MKQQSLIKYLFFFLVILAIAQSVTLLQGCANMIPPSGGPRDTIPPMLMKATPPDSTLQFKNKTIIFTFDEYIELQDIQKNVQVSPTPEINLEIEYRLKTITVKLKDTLEPNTTYAINFGRAIQDINERNVLKNFTYLFSTGSFFDSLSFSGNVVLAETGKTDSTLIVMLHRTGEDSAVINNKPQYITKLDGKGNFRFRFLPPGTYYVYALKDDNGLGKYFSAEQLFAFADEPVVVSDSTRSITLFAYAVRQKEAETPAPPVPQTRGGGRNNELARLRFTSSVTGGQQDLLEPFYLKFVTPLKTFDPAKVLLSTDTSFLPVSNYSWTPDSNSIQYTLNTSLKEDTRYNLILDKEFATDTLGLQLLKTDTISFRTRKLADYGAIRIRFKNLDAAKNPVLLISLNNTIIMSEPIINGEFYKPLFKPGNYDLSILYDDNKNGKWDPGEFFGVHRQPEHVVPLRDKIIVKPNWDNEKDIEIGTEPGKE
ncbi:MAG: hypothetical protein GC171_10040 [Terrimonas sp.]|nr:hypothetical protein [Terrimonas sp.]